MHTVKSRSPNIWVLICQSIKSKVNQNPVYMQCTTAGIVTQNIRLENLSFSLSKNCHTLKDFSRHP